MELFDLDGNKLNEEETRLCLVLGQNKDLICNKLEEMNQTSIRRQLRISGDLVRQEKTELELRKLAQEEGVSAGIKKVKMYVQTCEKILMTNSGGN